MSKLKIIYKKLDELIPYVNNPRLNDAGIDKVASSIKNFGFKVPITIDSKNEIITGHTRLLASKKLGLEEVPCVIADDLTEAQVKAFRIADNKVAEYSKWDNELLKIEFEELKELDFDLELTGFDLDELDFNLEDEKEVEEDDFDLDSALEDIVEPTSERGNIWQLGKHRLMCGDSTVITDVDKLMNGNKADMVFTDPPYGVEYQSNMRTKSKKFDIIKNDNVELDIVPIIKMFSIGWVFIWTTWKVLNKWIIKTEGFGYPSNMVVWFKGGGGIGDLKKTFLTDYEVALVFNRGAELCGKRIGSVWSIGKDGASSYVHPTQKPITLGAEAIDKTTKIGDKVLDLFGGSGSTLMACEQTNRQCYMMELDEKYVDVIIKRYETLTGNKAVLIEG